MPNIVPVKFIFGVSPNYECELANTLIITYGLVAPRNVVVSCPKKTRVYIFVPLNENRSPQYRVQTHHNCTQWTYISVNIFFILET